MFVTEGDPITHELIDSSEAACAEVKATYKQSFCQSDVPSNSNSLSAAQGVDGYREESALKYDVQD